MPTSVGPNPSLDSNIVFSYDTGDTSNSYRGEPTTNTVGNLNSFNPLDLYTWASSGNTSTWGRDTSVAPSPVRGIPLKEYSFGADSYSSTYNNPGNNISAASSGQTWTVSVYALARAGVNLQIWIFGANSSGNYIELDARNFTATGQWQRISISMTFTNGSTAYVQARVATSTNGALIWWDGLQVEQKSYPTQFTTGTRSATQGLLPLISNTSINLSTVSFNSNAQMYFDGTDDYVDLGSYLYNINTTTLSIEIVFKTNIITSSDKILLGWMEGETPHGYIVLGNFTGYWGNESISFYNEGSGTTNLSFAYTNGSSLLSDMNYHHVVFILQTGNYQIFVDGNQVPVNPSFRNGSQSTVMPSNLFGYGSSPSVVLGTGSNPKGGFFNGEIPITKIYNVALSADQVKQNYQQYKSRFNLS
jgi:hypothetical protein